MVMIDKERWMSSNVIRDCRACGHVSTCSTALYSASIQREMDWFDAVQRSAQIAEYGDEKDEHKLQFRYEKKYISFEWWCGWIKRPNRRIYRQIEKIWRIVSIQFIAAHDDTHEDTHKMAAHLYLLIWVKCVVHQRPRPAVHHSFVSRVKVNREHGSAFNRGSSIQDHHIF